MTTYVFRRRAGLRQVEVYGSNRVHVEGCPTAINAMYRAGESVHAVDSVQASHDWVATDVFPIGGVQCRSCAPRGRHGR